MHLGPQSSQEERLAFYRAGRAADSVPADASFFLIAWVFDLLTDDRAVEGLREVEDHLATHSSRRPASPSRASFLGSASRLVAPRSRTTPRFLPARDGLRRHASFVSSSGHAPRNQARRPPLLA